MTHILQEVLSGGWRAVVMVPVLAFALGILYLVGQPVYNIYLHPLARFPGPKLFAASRIPYLRAVVGGRLAQVLETLHNEYGEVVRIAPDELAFTNGEAWKPIYGTRIGHSQKPKDMRVFAPPANGHPTIIQSNDADHSRFRRLLSHAFSEASLRGQEPIIKQYIDLLIQRLHENASETEPVDMVAWYNFTTFDIIGDLTFGTPFDCLQNSRYHPWVSIIFGHIQFGAYSNVYRRFPSLKTILQMFIPKEVMDRRKWHYAITQEKVNGRLTSSNERPDFFSHILKHHETEKGMTVGELESNASTLVVAGSETTATLLAGATYYLLKSPRVLAKLEEEVRSAFKSDSEITLASCNQLTYIHAVINEALRMYPPVAVGLPRIVDAQGDMIAGQWVPPGTIVSVSQMAAYHSPANFTEPESFIPERFLGDPRFENDSKTVLQPFSFGPRNCIGRNLAYVEMRSILARMVFNFDMKLYDPSLIWEDQQNFVLWNKPELPVLLKSRAPQE
ncbi:cytochrome P450 [Aspergillus steynii IBT 23096]|uniref:Cytochrome P450 n=1 Tax=Aspergillus steynii IBT 23096 TaxID=1392250 RepID=A0A2I2GKX3_9EURO|nr:cytochrome P450 [Aspergillus steynii IBT 23096]PLB53530.1 cytochrome P450 [Aspergillus steynii IBT 23096]